MVEMVAGQRRKRSTKAGDYPRLRLVFLTTNSIRTTRTLNEGRRLPPATTPNQGRRASEVRSAQRRPEITPGYDTAARKKVHQDYDRSTKAGDYPRLRRLMHAAPLHLPSIPLNEGRRLPPATTTRTMSDFLRRKTLNEGRRLPPATTRVRRRSQARSQDAQRRPEITPGYDRFRVRQVRFGELPLNEGRRLPPATTLSWSREGKRRFSPLNEGRRLPPATTCRSREIIRRAPASLNEGRRLPPATTLFASKRRATNMYRAQRRPEITPGYDSAQRRCWRFLPSSSLNEGRRLPPATTPKRTVRDFPAGQPRSTKAGDYPRLRRPSERANRNGSADAQRRPEITPGYDGAAVCTALPVSVAQRRPEITPGYDGGKKQGGSAPDLRSTKAGDYPRLRPRGLVRRDRNDSRRSTKAGDYPRLRRGLVIVVSRRLTLRSTKAGDYPRLRLSLAPLYRATASHAQRRPEITPGYDAEVHVGHESMVAHRSTKAGDYPRLRREGQVLPHPGVGARSTKAGDYPRLRPEVVSASHVRVAVRSTKAGDYPRLRQPQLRASRPERRPLNEGRRLPPATTRCSKPAGWRDDPRSTKAGDYPRLRPPQAGCASSARLPFRSTKAGDYPRLRREVDRRTSADAGGRSTKAGDYPRLRRPAGGRTGRW